uniref:Lactonase family protein n=1 Tax=Prevotella sp. GTC17262 TaxID=3236797 RepID=A0AB33JJU5_9BACT
MLGLTQSNAKKLMMAVGTYTNGTSKGIYTFHFDDKTGVATPLHMLAMDNPSFLKLGRQKGLLYAVSEKSDATASINAIRLDMKTGEMTLLNTQPTNGEDPCHVETNGKVVMTANYSGGSLSVFPLNSDGTIRPMSQLFKGSTAPTDVPNQATPHIHCSKLSPDDKTVLASNFSANEILGFRVLGDGSLQKTGVVGTLTRNSGPRHIIYSDKAVYVMSEVSGAVTVFKRGYGEMKRLQEIQSDSVNGRGGADIHLSPNGKFLYTSNRLKADGISIFAVNKLDGTLTKIGYQDTGIHPRNFNITPNGRFLLCACRDSNKIQVFSINKETGLLTDTHQDIMVDKAVCIEF